MLDIKISDQIKSRIKNCVIASLQADIVVKSSNKLLKDKLDEACETFAARRYKIEDISKLTVIADSRKAYRALGKDPSRYRLSSEALLRRIVKEKDIYKINNIVDIINLISITSHYSICAFDVSKITPPVLFTIGKKEDEYYGIGRGLLNIENLPVFEDAKGKFGSPTSDSERTKITDQTRKVSLNMIAFNPARKMDFWLEQMKDYLMTYADGKSFRLKIHTHS